ncbi:hypothetical protein BDV95DRAFT_392662 [Massariosphaeria phaeospora]|uniref:C2H2-type domain-containing protein n=1 Tax=Massariosphaeria phaeospora TaxID=100035 RepID=A0A7C8ICE7_9PLEO|nr:hypothetical protein BDV95DRAFT_392662 [Massariosphaeria phaeospora]
MDNRYLSAFPADMDVDFQDFEMNHETFTFFGAQPAQHLPHDQQALVEHSGPEYSYSPSAQWQGMNFGYGAQPLHRRHISTSTQSSQSTNYRSSNGSIFSRRRLRDSAASANTALSHFSDASRDYDISHAEQLLSPPTESVATYPIQSIRDSGPTSGTQPLSQCNARYNKESFAPCHKRTVRPRRTDKEPQYWCTACPRAFTLKYDWKTHEEIFQERFEMYECDMCEKTYFSDKDFKHHHKAGHNCKTCSSKTCSESQHVNYARKERASRTGWGCGFCFKFFLSWTDRCNHVSGHFEKGDDIANWQHSRVILSLLQRDGVREHWDRLCKSTQIIEHGWSRHVTGRAEGYLDSGCAPHLQDKLEFFTPGQDGAALAFEAFTKDIGPVTNLNRPQAMRPIQEAAELQSSAVNTALTNNIRQHPVTAKRLEQTSMSSLKKSPPNKKLPLLPHEIPPKNHQSPCATIIDDLMSELESWDNLNTTIMQDPNLPTGVCAMDFNVLDEQYDSEFPSFQ